MLFRSFLLATLPVLARAGTVDFDAPRPEGFPHGLLTLPDDNAKADLPGIDFADGTIEFDMKALGDGMPGIRFHKQGEMAAEEVYLRTQPDCRAENDCVQYAPVIQGSMLWNVYPQYQSKAPVIEGWNHYKLVMSGHHLEISVNGAPTVAAHLESESTHGGIAFNGPAAIANLTLQPEEEADPRDLTAWRVAQPVAFTPDSTPTLSAAPGGEWAPLPADHDGLINLTRRFGRPLDGKLAAAWLKTSVKADQDMVKKVSMGWLGEAWVFAGGKLVFAGRNLYYPAAERRAPDGRLSLDNASFDLPLKAGANEIVVVLDDKFRADGSRYGWGLKMRLDDR